MARRACWKPSGRQFRKTAAANLPARPSQTASWRIADPATLGSERIVGIEDVQRMSCRSIRPGPGSGITTCSLTCYGLSYAKAPRAGAGPALWPRMAAEHGRDHRRDPGHTQAAGWTGQTRRGARRHSFGWTMDGPAPDHPDAAASFPRALSPDGRNPARGATSELIRGTPGRGGRPPDRGTKTALTSAAPDRAALARSGRMAGLRLSRPQARPLAGVVEQVRFRPRRCFFAGQSTRTSPRQRLSALALEFSDRRSVVDGGPRTASDTWRRARPGAPDRPSYLEWHAWMRSVASRSSRRDDAAAVPGSDRAGRAAWLGEEPGSSPRRWEHWTGTYIGG